jgi:hypothetical protein
MKKNIKFYWLTGQNKTARIADPGGLKITKAGQFNIDCPILTVIKTS